MLKTIVDAFAAVPEFIGLGAVLLGFIILLFSAVWPLDRGPEPDPMADAFRDRPNIDPRL